MDPIGSFSGLSSGIQWRDMVEQLMQLEISRKISPLQKRADAATGSRGAWNKYSGLLTKLVSATSSLRDQSAFNVTKANVALTAAGKSLLTASTSSAAVPGSYQVEVINLARAEKLSGSSFSTTSSAAGVSGEFYLNGRRIDLVGTDSLTAIRDKINLANSGSTPTGVTASILSTSDSQHRLVLTSDTTGARGIELVDGGTSALEGLGILSGTLAQNTMPGDSSRTQSQRFSSHTTKLAATLGVTPNPAVTTVVIDGRKIQVDLENDTLLSLATRIQAAGGSAEVVDESIGGRTTKRLSVVGEVTADATGSDPATSQRLVELLGFQTGQRSSQITTGQDAVFNVDGFRMTRRTNTVSDAISGVTLNLTASNAAQRSSALTGSFTMVADPKTIGAGRYAISLSKATRVERSAVSDSPSLTVASDPGVADGTYNVMLTQGMTRSSSATTGISVLAAPNTALAGTYGVSITRAASVASATGVAFDGTYNGPLVGSDTITIQSGNGASATISLTTGDTLSNVIGRLNSAFSASGATVVASDVGGQLKLTSTTGPGSASTFSVQYSNGRVKDNFGIDNGNDTGTDIAGKIGNENATGVGDVLTSTAGSPKGIEIRYSGSAIGTVGSVTVTDQMGITGGTIGGFAATWNEGSRTLSVAGGLSVKYLGAATSGSVGNITVSSSLQEYISGATIDGEAALYDESTGIISGASGGRFAGYQLDYTGPVASGIVGELQVDGDIAVEVTVTRDNDATIARIKDLAAAYNELVTFADGQKTAGAPLATNGALRTIQNSIKKVLLEGVPGLAASNPYTHTAIAGVALKKDGKLEVDQTVLAAALENNPADIRALFSKAGTPTDGRVAFESASDKVQAGSYAIAITAAATQATHTGSSWGGATYVASDGVDDVLTVTNSATGLTTSLTVTHGRSLSEVIAELNAQFTTDGAAITASEYGGGLRLQSAGYGSTTSLTIGGDAATRLGLTAGSYAGSDVAGTLGGLAATGSGQILTGTAGNAEGLAVRYTGTATGAAGDVSYVLGIAGMFERMVDPLTRAGDGTLPTQISSLDGSIESLNKRMDDAEVRLEVRRKALVLQFTRMESALSLLQSQGSWLTSQISSMQNANSQ